MRSPLAIDHAVEWTAAAGFEMASAVRDDFTGVFAADDELALGFMASMRRQGRSAPRDYSIVGIDDIPEAEFFEPALTSVRLDFSDVGRHALELLRSLIEEGLDQPVGVNRPRLVERASARPTAK